MTYHPERPRKRAAGRTEGAGTRAMTSPVDHPGLSRASRGSDARVMSLIGFVHATSHFFHLVIPSLFPWLMADFGLTFTAAGALTTAFFIVSGVGQAIAG